VINRLGYELLSNKRLDEAIEVLKLNVESYPKSSNAYDSLAEAYMMSGNKALAIKNYEKSLELNPTNAGALEALKTLRKR
jgi:tetratricopeptide (TPR) repeat protein